MEMSLLTYNVLFNTACRKLKPILEAHKPDIVCLQEVDTEEKNLQEMEGLKYKLADYSNSFFKYGKIYGVATFYNSQKIKHLQSDTLVLSRSIYEIVLTILRILRGGNKPRTVLKTTFMLKKGKETMTIYNIHLTALSTNQGKMKQIKQTLQSLDLDKNQPTILAGDFNYLPYNRKKLEVIMKNYNFKEATNNILYTIFYSLRGKIEKYNFLQNLYERIYRNIFSTDKLKVDYIFYKNLKLAETKKIAVNHSDHFPILSIFKV